VILVLIDPRPGRSSFGTSGYRGDAEVLGMPIAVVVGRGLKNGVVEVRNRRTGERREVPVAEAVTTVRELTGR